MKKGQGAMEYLMTYGWALLVIVVVGAALFALGVLNPNTYTQKRCQGFSTFQYQDHRAVNGQFTIDLINGARDMTVTSMTVNGNAVNGLNGTLTPSAGARFILGGNVATSAAGTSYNYPVVITYDVTNGIPGNTDRGTCLGTIA